MRKQITRAAALCLCCLLLLSGCRESPALTRVVYDYLTPTLSETPPARENSLENEETMDHIEDLLETEEAYDYHRQEDTGLEGDREELEQGAQMNYDPEASDYNGAAPVNPDLADPDPNADPSPTEEGTAGGAVSDSGVDMSSGQEPHPNNGGGSTAATDPDGSGETPPDNIAPNNKPGEDNGQSGGDRDQDAGKEIIANDGEKVDPPEVTGKVAAVGQAAILVELLGAGARLCATSAGFGENALARAAFPDAAPTLLWSGDGTQPLSDGDFAKLLALEPEACFELSGDMTFTETQIRTLNSLGIAYVVLPALTTAEGILQAVTLAADVLGDQSDTGGADAPAMAKRYLEWYQDTMAELKDLNGGNYLQQYCGQATLLVEGWDAGAEVTDRLHYYDGVTSGSFSGSIWADDVRFWTEQGAALIRARDYVTKSSDGAAGLNAFTYFVNTAGVADLTVVDRYYYVYTEHLELPRGTWCYVDPLSVYSTVQGGSGAMLPRSLMTGLFQAISSTSLVTSNQQGALGSSGWPAIIVTDSAIKEAMERSISWRYFPAGSPFFRGYGSSADSEGAGIAISNWLNVTTGQCGSLGMGAGYYLQSLITGDYDIYVNPAGLGDWTGGSPESILEAVWAASKFQGGEDSPYTEAWCREKITDFYHIFYRYDLTDSELDAILAGK